FKGDRIVVFCLRPWREPGVTDRVNTIPSVDVALRPADVRREIARLPGARHAAIARIDLFDDIAAAASDWRRIASGDAIATPFGRRDWVDLWQRHIGAPAGMRPLLAVA